MDLENLKKSWNKVSGARELDEAQLKEILGKKTMNLMERIDRNIRTGFFILLVLIILFVADDFYISPRLLHAIQNNISVPAWIQFLSIFSNTLIITTFLYFIIRYFRIRRKKDLTANLHDTLVKTVEILKVYKRMFYIVLFSLFLTLGSMFVAGLYEGVVLKAHEQGIPVSEIDTRNLVETAIAGLIILLVTVCGFLLFLLWGFNKLYGNYIHKLKLTLAELENIEE